MFDLFATTLRVLFCGFQSRRQLLLKNLALRHQLTVLQRSVSRAKLESADRFLWVLLLRCWSGWQRVLVIVQPRTVVAWHRAGFRCFWRWKSRPRTGRPPVNSDLIGLIRRHAPAIVRRLAPESLYLAVGHVQPSLAAGNGFRHIGRARQQSGAAYSTNALRNPRPPSAR